MLKDLLSGSFFLRDFRRGAVAVLAPLDFVVLTPPSFPSMCAFGGREAACPVGVAVCRVGELGEGGDERPGEVLSPRFPSTNLAVDIL